MTLDDLQVDRYSRQIILPEVGAHGQEALRASRVLLVALDAAVSTSAAYLAAAGVGTLGLVDTRDAQGAGPAAPLAYHAPTALPARGAAATRAIREIDPSAVVNRSPDLATALRDDPWDVVLWPASPSAQASACNQASLEHRVPGIVLGTEWDALDASASVTGVAGHLPGVPCWECDRTGRVERLPPPPAVASIVAGVAGALGATEALKLLLGIGTPILGRHVTYRTETAELTTATRSKAPTCPVCGPRTAPSLAART
jgi:adenylyltransferase/sulfurtransferase